MPTPPKPFSVLSSEKKSHRTKAELKQREKGEAALATGEALKARPEVKKNKAAYKEFKRLSALLESIEKNDAIYEIVINRYCTLVAECQDLTDKREKIFQSAQLLEASFEAMKYEADFDDLRFAIRGIADIYSMMFECDKQLQTKRKMLLDIEKENIMTIAAALRSIPKKTENKKSALLEALGGV